MSKGGMGRSLTTLAITYHLRGLLFTEISYVGGDISDEEAGGGGYSRLESD